MSETLLLVREYDTETQSMQTTYALHDTGGTYDELIQSMSTGLATDDPHSKSREYDVLEVTITRRSIIKRQVEAVVNVEVLPQPVDGTEAVAA